MKVSWEKFAEKYEDTLGRREQINKECFLKLNMTVNGSGYRDLLHLSWSTKHYACWDTEPFSTQCPPLLFFNLSC